MTLNVHHIAGQICVKDLWPGDLVFFASFSVALITPKPATLFTLSNFSRPILMLGNLLSC